MIANTIGSSFAMALATVTFSLCIANQNAKMTSCLKVFGSAVFLRSANDLSSSSTSLLKMNCRRTLFRSNSMMVGCSMRSPSMLQ